jgi:hypothetical protein
MFIGALRGAIVSQTVTTALVLYIIKPSVSLKEWYRTLGLSAMVLDILSLSLGAYVGLRFLPEDNLVAQIGIAVLTGIVHDLVFGHIVHSFQGGKNRVMDLFKNYAAEKKFRILFDDALMIAGAVVASRTLVCFKDADAITAVLAYMNLMLVHSF